jgi:RNA polymerase sigma-70 factor (ECF subfamily)
LSLDAETPELPQTDRDSPEAAFDRQWAVTVLARAMHVLERECATEGKIDLLDHLKPSLLGEAAYGDQNAAAEKLGLSAGAARVAVHRLRSRFRHCVKEEIASTLKDAASIEDEMRSLLAALGG